MNLSLFIGSTTGESSLGGHLHRIRSATAQLEKRQRCRCQATPFPRDYPGLIRQAQDATRAAIEDNKRLLEVEFPVASLSSVQGDEEGANEMTKSSMNLRQYSRMFFDDAENTRVFFPDLKEMRLQAEETWADTKIKLDYLTKPSGLLDIGIDLSGYDPTSNIQDESVFIAAYPSFDPRELVAADKVWKSIENDEDKTMIFFNGELCRLRSNYFPGLFYPEMARLTREMIPEIETVYYVHNFKGTTGGGGCLFRCYPGDWQVLLRVMGDDGEIDTVVVHSQKERPTLKEVSLDILPRACLAYGRK
jgi:hypothetical protein